MSQDTKITHRWHLQVQQGREDWETVLDAARPITRAELERYEGFTVYGGDAKFRVQLEVTTTSVQRTVIEPVPS